MGCRRVQADEAGDELIWHGQGGVRGVRSFFTIELMVERTVDGVPVSMTRRLMAVVVGG